MNDLEKFFRERTTEDITKWSNYFDIYEKYFSSFRNRPIHFLEIGVDRGGSSVMWKKYFGKDAVIVGIDIATECKKFENISEKRYIEIGDQSDPEFLKKIIDKYQYFNIILDDGSHIFEHQKRSLNLLWNALPESGIYMVEDVHTSYYPNFGEGKNVAGTFIEYAKKLIDTSYTFHRLDPIQPEEEMWQHTLSSITFHTGIVVMEKSKVQEPYTGRSGVNTIKTPAAQEALHQASYIRNATCFRVLLWHIKALLFRFINKDKALIYKRQLQARRKVKQN